jgi:hypothetical protein
MKRLILPGLGGAMLMLMLPSLQAQTCSGNGDVVGAYGFAASRLFAAVPATAPGTAGPPNTNPAVSTTDFGHFLAGVSSEAPFGTVGRLLADGAGGLFANASATSASPVQVGTYTVNNDCTMSVTFTDAFAAMPATAPGSPATPVTPVTATFQGVVQNHGHDIELVQTGSSATGAVVEMRHTLLFNGCTNATLTGAFGVISQASMAGTSATATPTAVPLFGRLVSNGNGMFGVDALGQKSSLPGLQLTGTYIVNPDCTGTAHVVTSGGVTRNLNFVIVQSDVGACLNGSVQPELLFGFTDSGISGIGVSR